LTGRNRQSDPSMRESGLLAEITDFYLQSNDYNGVPTSSLIAKHGKQQLRGLLHKLIIEGKVCVLYADCHLNPHILGLPCEPVEQQLTKLTTTQMEHGCVYPTREHLEDIIGPAEFRDRPYKRCLALGTPQLSHRSFDLAILEIYRNDPRYSYQYGDICGSISIKDEYFEIERMKESDQILLQNFGFSLDEDHNMYVAVFLRYLSRLSSEHQLIWASKEVTHTTRLHPDYFRISILGDWQERLSPYQAVLLEMKSINELSVAIGHAPLFNNHFSESNRPRNFGYLLRPTLKEYNDFVHLLDKMLSENINREFFRREVAFEEEEVRKDGKVAVRAKGTIQILEDWLRAKFQSDDRGEIEEMLETFRRVRSMRQKPAHSIKEDEFNQRYIHDQRDLMRSVYRAVKILRVILALHPFASKVEIDHYLQEGLIWPI